MKPPSSSSFQGDGEPLHLLYEGHETGPILGDYDSFSSSTVEGERNTRILGCPPGVPSVDGDTLLHVLGTPSTWEFQIVVSWMDSCCPCGGSERLTGDYTYCALSSTGDTLLVLVSVTEGVSTLLHHSRLSMSPPSLSLFLGRKTWIWG